MSRSLALKADAASAAPAIAGETSRLIGALAALPPLTRSILILYRMELLPMPDIGRRLRMPEAEVRDHVAFALARLGE